MAAPTAIKNLPKNDAQIQDNEPEDEVLIDASSVPQETESIKSTPTSSIVLDESGNQNSPPLQ